MIPSIHTKIHIVVGALIMTKRNNQRRNVNNDKEKKIKFDYETFNALKNLAIIQKNSYQIMKPV